MVALGEKLWRNYIETLVSDTREGFQYVKESGPIIAIVALIAIPLGYSADITIAEKQFTLPLRIAAMGVSAGLLFTRMVRDEGENYYVGYWFFALCSMIALWTAMMLFNAAILPSEGPHPDQLFWLLQYLVGLFLYTQLCTTPQLGITGWVIANALVYSWIAIFFENPNWDAIHALMTYPAPLYVLIIVVGATFNRNKSASRNESLSAVRSIGSNIAHEIRSPISGISSRARGVTQYIPALIDGYHAATANNIIEDTLTPRQIGLLVESMDKVGEHADNASTLIDMVLMTTVSNPSVSRGDQQETFAATYLVDAALSTFPYKEDRQRLSISEDVHEDFEICGTEVVARHVLFNLLQNALTQIHNKPDGAITVTIEAGRISVRDNGPGVPQAYVESIFEQFFTLTPEAASSGNGLHFCRSAMAQMGGDLRYERTNEQTSFVMTFPKAD